MADKIKIGHDKLPAPVVPTNVPLYNEQTSSVLTDEGGIPIVSAQDIILASQTVSDSSTSVVFTDEIKASRVKKTSLSGSDFQALNNAIYVLSAISSGSNFNTKTDAEFTVPLDTNGIANAKIKYSSNQPGFTSGVNSYEIVEGGGGYTEGFEFEIPSDFGGSPARFRVDVVQTEVLARNGNFTKELKFNSLISLPTGLDSQGNIVYERRRVDVIKNNNSILFAEPISTDRKRTDNGVGFGKIELIEILSSNSTIPIEEQFAAFSEVSTTILGYPKAETQLGLFSNVSSYGLDDDEFLFYRSGTSRNEPFNWETRKSLYYGNHIERERLREATEESALILESFSTPYTYPYGPNANNYGWSTGAHANWNRFVKLGCLLYDWYKPGGGGDPGDGGAYARNFLPYIKDHVALDGNNIVLYDDGTGAGDRLASVQPNAFVPSGDPNGIIIRYFKDNEELYLYEDWNQTTNTFTGTPVGTVKIVNFDYTLHFNEEIGDLLENYRIANGNIDLILVGKESLTQAPVVSDMNWFTPFPSAPYNNVSRAEQNFWINIQNPRNPYYSTERDLFNQIDVWTETWRQIRSGTWNLPGSGGVFDVEANILFNPLVLRYIYNDAENSNNGEYNGNVFLESLPGHGSNIRTDCTLLSRKAFRYQPGRISGFTFGVRASGDASTNDVIIEWGIGNDTDQLVFQLKGSNFNIVRRSIVPLSDSVMRRNNLDPGDSNLEQSRNNAAAIASNTDLSVSERISQLETIFGTEVLGSNQYPVILPTQNQEEYTGLGDKIAFETKIPNSLWNGDPLNGNGPSGWDATTDRVTMYKIEFGWYGAIGVRFYAYVPINNNEARWVTLHTLVIENQLGVPSMGDPYYKFLYKLIIENHDKVSTPKFVYKYGTSCYIDGGDEGTVNTSSAFSGFKLAPVEDGQVNRSTTIVGLIPKTVIYNSLGKAIKNKQSIYPRELSLTADGLTEVSLVKCSSCPGYAHAYMPNISSGYRGDERYLKHPSLAQGVNRSELELPKLTRLASGSAGSNQVVLATSVNDIAASEVGTNPLKFIRVGDVFDPDNTTGAFTSANFEYAYITDIDSATNTITLDKNLGVNVSGDVDIQPIFLESVDLYAKIISSGVYLTYVGPYDGTGGYNQNISPWDILGFDFQNTYNNVFPSTFGDRVAVKVGLATTDGFPIDQVQPSEYYFAGNDPTVNPYRELEEKKQLGFFYTIAPTEFPCRLSQYKAVAGSTVALYGKENDLLWLAPGSYGNNDTGSYSDGQFADYRVGITNLKPIINTSTKELIQWENPRNPGVPVKFTADNKITAERYDTNIVRSIDRYEIGEDNRSFVPPFTVDYRIASPPGTNSGRCQYVKIKIDDPIVKSYYQWSGSGLRAEFANESEALSDWLEKTGEAWSDSGYYLLSQSTVRPTNYNILGAEIAYNPNLLEEDDPFDPNNLPTIGTDIRFSTDWIAIKFPAGAGEVTYYVARIKSGSGSDVPIDNSKNDGDQVITYSTKVTLVSFRKFAEGSFDYNPFPLYFFAEFRDGTVMNGPQIREIGQVENNYNPLFGVSESMSYYNSNIRVGTVTEVNDAVANGTPELVTTSGGLDDAPPNFTSTDRLSSALVDIQGTAQLRPFELIDKLYVGKETKQVDLRPIFDFQKETITPDLLNTTAYFFLATCKEPGETFTEVSGTLNYLEQQ